MIVKKDGGIRVCADFFPNESCSTRVTGSQPFLQLQSDLLHAGILQSLPRQFVLLMEIIKTE